MTEAQLEQKRNNVTRIAGRKRAATHCRLGHNKWVIRKTDGRRQCAVCKNDATARASQKRREKKNKNDGLVWKSKLEAYVCSHCGYGSPRQCRYRHWDNCIRGIKGNTVKKSFKTP